MISIWLSSFIVITLILLYQRAALSIWTIATALYLLLLSRLGGCSTLALTVYWVLFLTFALPLNILPLRRKWLTSPILSMYKKVMPQMSYTEKAALSAGTVGWEAELFTGAPHWPKLHQYPINTLTAAEESFIDGPVAELCKMLDEWDITHHRKDLPDDMWQFLKVNGFFGLIIPKEYGGKGFSALAHSAILQKIYSRSITVASTVAVPNSLGPAELLLHYGTEQQKNYYLPRLATGDEIPCFALTSPEAGSDAGAIPDTGIICKGIFEGKEIIGIRLNWDKRYITLAPVATVLGLAFKLYDPEHLLGSQELLGITCALIPTHTPGINIGRRHFPLNNPFQNGPTQGKDVFIPFDWLIGGIAMAGHGWQMLVECLSVGRAITLPTGSVAGAKVAALTSGAYARIRKQFNQPIGYFEGIEEPLARLAGFTYLLDAGRELALSAIDRGEKPAVISAIMKYHATERSRQLVIDAMDIHAGKGICLGPRNYLGRFYEGAPITITVEGANILTRNMIIFGQGAIRCHPYLLAELEAAQESDPNISLQKFDKAIFGHIGFTLGNIIRSLVLGLTGGRVVILPSSPVKRYYQLLTRYSASFALLADMTMFIVGGELKRKERLSARFGDILSMLYLSSAVLKRYADRDYPQDERILVDWSCQTLLATIVQQLDSIVKNFPFKPLGFLLRGLIFPLGKRISFPSDRLDRKVAQLLLTPSAVRDRLTAGIDTADTPHNPIALLEKVLPEIIATEPLYRTLHKAQRSGQITGLSFEALLTDAISKGLIATPDAQRLRQAEEGRKVVIAVDDFARNEL